MLNVKDIRNKITSVQRMQKITKAIEMVSASKMRKLKNRIVSCRSYMDALQKIISHISVDDPYYTHRYLEKRDVRCVGYLVISTNHGLCGCLNTKLFKKVISNITTWGDKGIQSSLVVVGSKGVSFFESFDFKIISQFTTDKEKNFSLSDFMGPTQAILQAYDKGTLDKVYIANNKFVNNISQIPYVSQLIPITVLGNEKLKTMSLDYLYEPDQKILLDILLQRHVELKIYQGIIENLVSEQASRMLAMRTAADNSTNLAKDLQLMYNKTRQSSITKELTEIISGSLFSL